jgi:hypothetical protein
MCVDVRCTIVTSAPISHSAPQMSKAELLLPDDDDLPAAYASGPGCAEEWCWSPAEDVLPGQLRDVGLAGHARWPAPAAGAQGERLAVALDVDGPLPAARRRTPIGATVLPQ